MKAQKTAVQKQIAAAMREHLERIFETQLKQYGISGYVRQYCPILGRKYRSFFTWPDKKIFAWPDKKIIVEIQGGTWVSGRHNRPGAMAAEYNRHNDLAAAGWRVFYFDCDQVKVGHAALFMQSMLGDLPCG